MIVDLSSPCEHNVNDSIYPAYSLLSYASVDDAVSAVLKMGVVTELIKIDLRMHTTLCLSFH